MKISKVWKAVAGGLAAGSAAAATAVQDGTVTTAEGITIALAVLGAYAVTWAVPNRGSTDAS
ncbi:hypothetical protein [Streptomyces sp. NPDC002520]